MSKRISSRLTPNYLVQLLVLAVCAFVLTRVGADLLDRATFSPRVWGHGWIPYGASSFHEDIILAIPLAADEGDGEGAAALGPTYNYTTDKGEVTTMAVFARQAPGHRAAEVVWSSIVSRSGQPFVVDPNRKPSSQVAAIAAAATGKTHVIARSEQSWLTGRRVIDASRYRQELRSICKAIDCENADNKSATRWMQAVIDSVDSGARLNTQLLGFIQWLEYLFAGMAFVLMLIEAGVLRRSSRVIHDRDLLPIFPERVDGHLLQRLLNQIRGLRMKRTVSEELLPEVALDLLEPGYKALLASPRSINQVEIHTMFESAAAGTIERLNARFQILRYFVFTIPSLGFIGTVMGIGEALGVTGTLMAPGASAVDKLLANYTLSMNLHVAFDTTLVGLVLSIALSCIADLLETREIALIMRAKKRALEMIGNVREVVPFANQGSAIV